VSTKGLFGRNATIPQNSFNEINRRRLYYSADMRQVAAFFTGMTPANLS
jgi:hypothetical protein